MTFLPIFTSLATFFLFTISFLTHTVFPYMFTGMQIRDLEGTGADFIADAASWFATQKGTTNVYTTDCGVYLIGGYNVLGAAGVSSENQYFYRTYNSLPSHTMIRYSFTFYALDTWDISAEDGFRLAFDTKVVEGWQLDSSTFQPSICGISTAKDLASIRVFGTVIHSALSLTFKIISDFNEPSNNESFGFRDLVLVFSQGPVTTETQCARQLAGITVPKQCTCAEGSFYTTSCQTCNGNCASCFGSGANNCFACKTGGYGWDGFNCIACNSYCYDCYGTAVTQCTACKPGYAYYAETTTCLYDCPFPLTKTAKADGSYVCTSPCAAGSFIYWDKSCSTCAAPFVQKTFSVISGSTLNLCTYPCTSTEYLYWDGTCKPDCGFPLKTTIVKGMRTCTYKCTDAQYLTWNDACVATCNYPLVRRVVAGKNICASPCYLSTDFVYWNQECFGACVLPLKQRTDSNLNYCDYPCQLNSQYLYWNGSCIDSCPAPLKVRFERGEQFCDYPGNTANFLYWDGTDSPTCDSPLIQKTEGTSPILKFCTYGCNDWEFLYWNGACANSCKFPLQTRIQNGKQFCDYGTCTGTDSLFWDGSCRPASTCTAPLLPRSQGGKPLCDFPAGNTSNFLYWDGTFSAVCPAPLTQRIDGTSIIRKFCDYKCTNPAEYLAFNDQCLSTCDAPHIARTQNGKLFCNFACGTQYLFHNNTCRESCPPPYVGRIDGLGKYCDHPCTDTTDFYYWNGVCDPTCPAPLQQITVETTKWCIYPCSANQFLAPNGVCLDACDLPFTTTKISDMKYCSSSCLANEYLFWDGNCLPSCESPLRKVVTDVGETCKLPCDSPEEYYDESTGGCIKTCDTTSIKVNGQYLLCQTDRGDTSSFFDVILEAPSKPALSLVVLTKLTTHIKYLDMDLPTRVKKLAVGKGRSILSLKFGAEMDEDMQNSFKKYDIPAIFLKQGAHSNFLVNFWEELTSWCIVIVTIVVFLFGSALCKARDWRAGQEFCEKIVTILKWNVMIIFIATSLGDILLYTSFELRTLSASSSLTGISREVCLLIVSLGIMVIIGTGLLSLRYKAVKETGPPHKVTEFKESWKGYQVLYSGYNNSTNLSTLFYLAYLFRIILCSVVTAFLFFSPFFQTLMYVIISVAMIGYIVHSRPLTSKLNYIQLLITEILTLTVNASLFALAILTRSNRQNTSLGIMFGDLAVGCNSCINLLFIVILAIKLIYAAKTVCIYQGAQRKHDSSAWVYILTVIPSQGGFGFEEISVNTSIQVRETRERLQQQTLVTETSQVSSKRLIRNNSNRITPEPNSQLGASMQLTSQADREGLDTWEGNRDKEMRIDSVWDGGMKEDGAVEFTTSRFGSDTGRMNGLKPLKLDLQLLKRMEKETREGYPDQE